MAGRGQRFIDAGYKCPKYMIDALGKSLFEWSMLSLADFFSNKFIFIIRKEDEPERFMVSKCASLGINDFDILSLPATTDGQATTVLAAADYLNDSDSIAVYNIDTHVKAMLLKKEDLTGEGFIPGFRAEGSKWSFISLDINQRVVNIAEKVPISDIATLGFYYFKSFRIYKEYYNRSFQNNSNLVNGEKYIAPIYKTMIEDNLPVFGSIIPTDGVWGLGTPDDLNFFVKNYDSK